MSVDKSESSTPTFIALPFLKPRQSRNYSEFFDLWYTLAFVVPLLCIAKM